VDRFRTISGAIDGDVDNQTNNSPLALAAGWMVFVSGQYEAA